MVKINTFLIGAQKAGTTSLYDWLGQHPDINAPSEVKDYHFFSNKNLYKKGIPHIHSFFNNEEKIQLHAAVNYLFFHETVAKRLYNYNPNAKIVICLRNPIDRAISAYKYFVRINQEKHSFNKALLRELNEELTEEELSDFTYLKHGKYMEQINGFLKFFDKSQCHFLLFEELINESKREDLISNLFRFLKIDQRFKVNYTHRNKSGQLKSNLLGWLLKEEYALKLVIKRIFPYRLRKKIGHKIEELNITDKDIQVNVTEKKKDIMKKYFIDSIQDIENFLNRDLSLIWDE